MEKKETTFKFFLPILAVMIIVTFLGYSASHINVGETIASKAVGKLISNISTEVAGFDVSFDYESIKVEGGFAAKDISIVKPVLNIKNIKTGKTSSIKGDFLNIHPQDKQFKEGEIEFPRELYFYQEGAETHMLEFDSSMTAEFERNGSEYKLVSNLAKEAVLYFINDAYNIKLSLPEKGRLESVFTNIYPFSGKVAIASDMLKIFIADKNIYRFGGLEFQAEQKLQGVGKGETKLNISSNNLTINDKTSQTDIYKLKLNTTINCLVANDWRGCFDDEYKLNLYGFNLSSALLNIDLSADIHSSKGDSIPSGEVSIWLGNYPYIYDKWLKHFVPRESKPIYKSVLSKAVGQKYADIKDVDLKLSHKNGVLKIGVMNIGDIIGLVLKDLSSIK